MEASSVEHCLSEAVTFFQQGERARAVTIFEQILAQHASRSDVRQILLQIYQAIGDRENLLIHALYLVRYHPEALPIEAQLQVIGLQMVSGNTQPLPAILALVAERYRANESIQVAISDIYRTLGMFDRALMGLRHLIFLNPGLQIPNNTQHVSQTVRARVERLQLALDRVRRDLKSEQECAHCAPCDSFHQLLRANALMSVGQISHAVEIYRSLIDLPERIDEALRNLGVALFFWAEHGRRHELYGKAADYFSVYFNLHSDDVEALLLLASCVHASPELAVKFGEATTLYQSVIEKDPGNAKALYQLADIVQRAGDMQGSFHYFRRYVEAREAQAQKHPLGKLGIRFLDETVTYAMGHLAFLPDLYKKHEKIGWSSPTTTVLLAPTWFTANRALLKQWEKHFCIIEDDQLIRDLRPISEELIFDSAFCRLPDGTVKNSRIAVPWVEREYERQQGSPLLVLEAETRERGWRALEQAGIKRGSKLALVHVRESSFKNEAGCAHNAHRNANIEDYLYTIERLIKRGYHVIRMGEASMKPILPMTGLFDYGYSDLKSDWMDVFLCAEAQFFLGTSGGLFATPQSFGKPILCTNCPPTFLQHTSRDLLIPKLLKVARENRLVTFREILSPPLLQCESGQLFADMGIEFIDNSPEELWQITEEMVERIEGTVIYTDDDRHLQQRFRELTAATGGLSIIGVGRDFLRKYRNLLE